MSGGEKRVAKARETCENPFNPGRRTYGYLDSHSGDEVAIIDKLNKENGITLIIVTHDTVLPEDYRRVIHFMDGAIVKMKFRNIFDPFVTAINGIGARQLQFLTILVRYWRKRNFFLCPGKRLKRNHLKNSRFGN
jgi:putative ABC transport system ATP-binding protein